MFAAILSGGTLVALWSLTLLLAEADIVLQAAGQSNSKTIQPPPEMVWIPGGEFTMGTDDVRSFPNERPAHRVHVEGFWIDEHDVTNAEFAKFVAATGYI